MNSYNNENTGSTNALNTLSNLTERVSAWNFVKIPGACASDQRYETLTKNTFKHIKPAVIEHSAARYQVILDLYPEIIKKYVNHFTIDFKAVTQPDFIYATNTEDVMTSFIRSINAVSTSFIYEVPKLKKLVEVPTDKGVKISIPILIRLNPILQYAVLSQITQFIPAPKIQRHHTIKHSFMKNFNTSTVSTTNDIMKEELRRENIKRLFTTRHHQFYRKMFDSTVIGARINTFADNLRACAQMEQIVVTPTNCMGLLLSLTFKDVSNKNLELIVADLSFPNCGSKVHSRKEAQVLGPFDMSEIYNIHMNRHLNTNDHHPQFYEELNLNIGVKATIEILCDLTCCALQQGCRNVPEAIYTISKWMMDANNNINHKYRKLDPFGMIIFAMRAEFLFSGNSVFSGVHHTRDWRDRMFHSDKFFSDLYKKEFTPRWRETSIYEYWKELKCHTHMVNTMLKGFGMRAKHDNDKFEYYCMIAYTYNWGSTIKTEPVQTADSGEQEQPPPETEQTPPEAETVIPPPVTEPPKVEKLEIPPTDPVTKFFISPEIWEKIEKTMEGERPQPPLTHKGKGEGKKPPLKPVVEEVKTGTIPKPPPKPAAPKKNKNANDRPKNPPRVERTKEGNSAYGGLTGTIAQSIFDGSTEIAATIDEHGYAAVKCIYEATGEMMKTSKEATEAARAVLSMSNKVEFESLEQLKITLAAFIAAAEANTQASDEVKKVAINANTKIDSLEIKLNRALDKITNAQIPECITGVTTALIQGTIAPFKEFIGKIAGFVRTAFDSVYDIFAKILLPKRTGGVLRNFTDDEVVETIVIMIVFFYTNNILFRTILAARLCAVLDVTNMLSKAYNYVLQFTKVRKQKEQTAATPPPGVPPTRPQTPPPPVAPPTAPPPPRAPPTTPLMLNNVEEVVMTADGDGLPSNVFEVIVSMLTEPTVGTYAALLSTVAVCYFGVSAASINTKSLAQTAIQSLRNVGFAAMGISALPKLVSSFSEAINFISESYKTIKTGERGQTVTELNTRAVKALLAASTLEQESMRYHITRCPKTAEFAKKTLKEIDELISIGGKQISYSHHYLSQLLQLKRRLEPINTLLQHPERFNKTRTVPCSIQFTGMSQIGKSEVMTSIAYAIERKNWPTQVVGSEIYTRNNGDDFMSNYNSEHIFVRDDVFAVADDREMAEWIGMKSSAPLYLNMAAMNDKGKPFVSEFIITSTNTPYPEQNTVRHNPAVHNRRDLLINVSLAEGWTRPITEAQYVAKGHTAADMKKFLHCEYSLLPPLAGRSPPKFVLENDKWVLTAGAITDPRMTYEELLTRVLSYSSVYNTEKRALSAAKSTGRDFAEALYVENIYNEIRERYPNAVPTSYVAGVPHLTSDDFREKYMSEILDDLEEFDIEAFIENTLKQDFDLREEEEPPEETSYTDLKAKVAALTKHYATMWGVLAIGKRLSAAFATVSVTNAVCYCSNLTLHYWCMDVLNACFEEWMTHRRNVTSANMENFRAAAFHIKGVQRDPNIDIAVQSAEVFDTLSFEEFQALVRAMGLNFYDHPVPKKEGEWEVLRMIPYTNQAPNCFVAFLNNHFIHLCTNDQEEIRRRLAISKFYSDHHFIYSSKYNLRADMPVLPTNLRIKMQKYLGDLQFYQEQIQGEVDLNIEPTQFPQYIPDTTAIRVTEYAWTNESKQLPSYRDSVKLGNIAPGCGANSNSVVSLRMIQHLRPFISVEGVQFGFDLYDLLSDLKPGDDIFRRPEAGPARCIHLLKTKFKEEWATLLHTISSLGSCTHPILYQICNWVAERTSPYLSVPGHLRSTAQTLIENAQANSIPNGYNRFELFMSSRIVGAALVALMGYVCYRYIRDTLNFFFPPAETSKEIRHSSKAHYLGKNIVHTDEVIETSFDEAKYNSAKSMIKRAVRLVLHTKHDNKGFNGHCFGQNIVTVAHPFLGSDILEQEFLDLSVMIGTSVDDLQRFRINVKKSMVLSTKNDCALIRIPEMRFFKKMPAEWFSTEQDFLKCNFLTENLYGHAFMKDGFLPLSISGARFVNAPKLVNSSTQLTLPNYLIFSGTQCVGTSGTLFYRIRDNNTIQVLGVQSCTHLGNSFIAPITREWVVASLKKLDQHWPDFEHKGPIACCAEEPHTRITLRTDIPVVGAVPRGMSTSSMTQTRLRKTIISDDYHTGEIPAILNPRDPLIPDGSHPLQHSANKWCALEMKPPQEEILSIVREDLYMFYKGLLKDTKLECDHSLEKVIIGHSSPIALNTSPGLPWALEHYRGKPQGKRAYMNINEQGEVDYISDELREAFYNAEQSLASCVIPKNSNYVFAKDELRPAKKVIGPPVKTRSISVMDQVFCLIYRKYNMDLDTALAKLADGCNPYCVGISPESPTGHSMYEHLKTVGTQGFDLDVPHWDGHFPAWLFIEVAKHKCRMYNFKEHSKEYNIMLGLTLNALFGFEQCEDVVYQKPSGIPSGYAGTGPDNTRAHIFLSYYIYIDICYRSDNRHLANWHSYRAFVCEYLYGDDKVTTVHESIEDWFNAQSVAEAYNRLGWPVTTAVKGDKIVLRTPLEDLQFLKRKWIPTPSMPGYYNMALDKNTIDRLCEWYKHSPDHRQQQRENFWTHLEFSYYHGPNHYNQALEKLNSNLLRVGENPISVSYGQMADIIRSRYWAAFPNGNRNDYINSEPVETNDFIPLEDMLNRATDEVIEVGATEALLQDEEQQPRPRNENAITRRLERISTQMMRTVQDLNNTGGTDWFLIISLALLFVAMVMRILRRT